MTRQTRAATTKEPVDDVSGQSHQHSCDHSIVGGAIVTDDPESTPAQPTALGGERNRRAIPTSVRGETVSDLSVLLGAFSILTFWAFGVGIALGVAAVFAAAGAAITAVTDERSDRPVTMWDAAVGAGAGVMGILASWYFLSTI